MSKFNFKGLLGSFTILTSALCFYLATTTIRWAKPHVDIDASYFVFARFFTGFLVVSAGLIIKRKWIKPVSYHYLWGRTITNAFAVFCFYKAVELTSVAEGNILNMTYPIFVALFSWFLLKDQRDLVSVFLVIPAFLGVWLILAPGELGFNLNSLWGIASGSTASFAIIYLNLSRKVHDTDTILFFMFGVGSVIIFLMFRDKIFLPDREELFYLVICSIFGISGQYFLTIGFKYVTAVEGGIISSSRILLAALLGPYVASDAPLSFSGWIGAILIFGVNVLLTLRKAHKSRQLTLKGAS